MTNSRFTLAISSIFLAAALAVFGATPARAQTFHKIYAFDGTTGSAPQAGVIQGFDGNLYGTATSAGTGLEGILFKLSTTGGHFTVLYNLCQMAGCADGQRPYAPMVQAANGSFYGTTLYGGTGGPCISNQGCGVIYRVTSNGTYTNTYNFCSQPNCTDGESPVSGGLAIGTDGNLYGVTEAGGFTAGCPVGCGTIFKITPAGNFSTIYNFCSQSECIDGIAPVAGLTLGRDGNFYGTTSGGGNAGRGVVYKITRAGILTVIYSFCQQSNCADGLSPESTLVQATNGNFYGTTTGGGANSRGTVFSLTLSGTLTTLYNFCALTNCADGYQSSGLIQATDGNFYGTTTQTASTIYEVSSAGQFTTLYTFCTHNGCPDGFDPAGLLMQDTNGLLYGTASGGGSANGAGSIYSFDLGLGPFVKTQPFSGAVGSPVIILGTNLTGATSVTFNGTAAVFTVKSPSEITTTVPSGATTGKVKVTTPGATLTSNLPFTVR